MKLENVQESKFEVFGNIAKDNQKKSNGCIRLN
jgi:hypothetical protein